MSEKELDSYRFLSGEDPTDEMLECIMKEAAEEAIAKKKKAEERMAEFMRKRRVELHAKYSEKIREICGDK
ncbi:MAG: hypothetical protein J1F16_10240 [Muribaculaceae bacterium]|nr:hypothetical protein [Muribaculaceae bacterium]MCH5228172.1 hypothetical protein [Muribaculaceae bacterium]